MLKLLVVYRNGNFLWSDEVGNARARLKHRDDLSAEEQMMLDAFYNPKCERIDYSAAVGPLTTEERASLFGMMSGKQPGLSSYKLAVTKFFDDAIQDAIVELINAQICLALIPTENKRVKIVHIDKPDGGSRPLSLFEELTKAVEGIVSQRLDSIHAEAGAGGILSASNHAYQAGRRTHTISNPDV